MYGNLGELMSLYREDPKQVASYFTMRLLRSKRHVDKEDEDVLDDVTTFASITNAI